MDDAMEVNMSDLSTLLTAFFAGLAALAGLFFTYMGKREKAAELERKATQKQFERTLDMFAKATDKNTKAMQEVAKATTKSAKEAEKRNGHLAELQLASQKMIADNLKAIHHVKEQHVEHQVVENETVEN